MYDQHSDDFMDRLPYVHRFVVIDHPDNGNGFHEAHGKSTTVRPNEEIEVSSFIIRETPYQIIGQPAGLLTGTSPPYAVLYDVTCCNNM